MSTNENIKAYRIKNGLSQDELAKKVGYGDRSSIAKIENGGVDLSESKIVAFAKAFDISPAELMGFVVPQEPYSGIFRAHMTEELDALNTDAFAGEETAEADYRRLLALSESSKPLSLSEACEAADVLGHSVSFLLGEYGEEIEDLIYKAKKIPDVKNTSRKSIEQEIILRLSYLDISQLNLLLATLQIATGQAQEMPVASRGSADGKDE